MIIRRFGFVWMAAALVAAGVTGCATKKYVRTQTAPIIQHAGKLNNETAANNRRIYEVNQNAQEGIAKAQNAANTANENAQKAGQAASTAQSAANSAVNSANSLDSVVKGLDKYHQVASVSVHFAFAKAVLTPKDKEKLNHFATTDLEPAQNYILEVTGGTDWTGPRQYNDQLSEQRARTVVQYLASKYHISARRFYVIGVGKDEYVATNQTAAGRAQNRRVTVQMLTNMPSGSGNSNQTAQSSMAPE